MEEYAKREVDYYDRIEKGDQQIWNSVSAELASLQTKMFEGLAEQDSLATDTNFKCERIDRTYQLMKEDVLRHETLSFELAKKFESQHEILLQFAENVEAIKSHALMTDLHLEGYLPL